MKKLLVLALVLALTSMASAVLTQNPGGGGTYLLEVGQTLTIEISESTGNQAGMLVYAIVEDGGDGALSNGIATSNAGELGAVNDYSYAGWGVGYELASGSTTGQVQAGIQWTVDYYGANVGDIAVISIWDGGGSFEVADDSITVEVVPEPMTIALLGLGGLFLRRRK
jgi:hypothetical protein